MSINMTNPQIQTS